MCPYILDFSPVVNEDQSVGKVGVVQPTYAIIHDEYVPESKEEPTVKEDSLQTVPHLLYLDIPYYSTTADFPCEKSFSNISTFDHSQGTSDLSLSLHYRKDTSSSEHPSNLSSIISKIIEGEHPCFSSTSLHDSSNHEDTKKHPRISDPSCHDLSTSSSNHDVYSIIVNLSKTLVYDGPSIDKVETPQAIEALQPELMVMSVPRCLEVGFTSD